MLAWQRSEVTSIHYRVRVLSMAAMEQMLAQLLQTMQNLGQMIQGSDQDRQAQAAAAAQDRKAMMALVQGIHMGQAQPAPQPQVAPGNVKGISGSVFYDRPFQTLAKFTGKEDKWAEHYAKFTCTVLEQNPEIQKVMKWAEEQDQELLVDDIITVAGGDVTSASDVDMATRWGAALKIKIHLSLDDTAWSYYNSIPEQCNGFEVWRRLTKKYNPRTPIRGMQLMVKVTGPGKAKKGEDLSAVIARWETRANLLERDYGEKLSERMRVGILIQMVPDDMQEMILQHLDDATEYKPARDKILALMDARGRLKDPNAMDVGALTSQGQQWTEGGCERYHGDDGRVWVCESTDCEMDDNYFGIDALAKVGPQCYNCHGYGHQANVCPSKGGGKGQGGDMAKGKGKGKGKDGKGNAKGGGKGKGTLSSKTPCPGCGKVGHGKEQCYTLHPELMWWKSANSVEEETAVALGSLEKDDRVISMPALRPLALPPCRRSWKRRIGSTRSSMKRPSARLGALEAWTSWSQR